MDLTDSYREILPGKILERFELAETRNAARILHATNQKEFDDVVRILSDFKLLAGDMTVPGGRKSELATRLDTSFREVGWREGRHDTKIVSILRVMPYKPAGEKKAHEVETEVLNEGYKVDNVKGRVALDVEWNAKDGNLDRDVGAYRAFYEAGIIDGAIIVTRTHNDLALLSKRLGAKKFGTTTTTNLGKLIPRLTRGDAGGCPVLAIAITAKCFSES